MKRKNFSLIELLIVIGILGALLTLVLPGFNNTSDDAKDKVALAEMKEIQSAFRRFAADMMFREDSDADIGNEYLLDVGKYGLWPLMSEEHPVLNKGAEGYVKYNEYNSETGLGRRGPYLREEGYLKLATAPGLTENFGQPRDESGSGTISVPVVKDPYGGYYRVIVPAANTSGDGSDLPLYKRLQKMVLVCTGPNGELDTEPTSFFTGSEENYHKNMANDIKAQKDDTVIRLMPLSGY